MIKIGCCGFPVARKKYYEVFSVVEIQQTFYQLPKPETVQKWRDDAPADFEFTMKAWQGITHPVKSPTYRKVKLNLPPEKLQNLGHFQPTPEVMNGWQKTVEVASILEASVILLQCPPGFQETEDNVENLTRFFTEIKKSNFQVAIEFRKGWTSETIQKICDQFGIIHCVDLFKEQSVAGGFRYYRLHGSPPGKQMYKYKYNEKDFARLTEILKKDVQKFSQVYLFFNNVYMWDDAISFKNFCKINANDLFEQDK